MDSFDEAIEKNQTSIESENKRRLNIQIQKEAGRALALLERNKIPMASEVFITTDNGRIECENKEELEWSCITVNHRRFKQVHNRPPMKQENLDWLGTCAENDSAEGILNGT